MIQNKKFLIVGTVRNCENTLICDVDRILKALPDKATAKWMLVESDSSDLTLSVLSMLEKKIKGFNYISTGNLNNKMPLRADRIAYCRNIYLNEFRNGKQYQDVDYIIASDFDGINYAVNKQSINSCWDRDGWDVCTANSFGNYYDLWALRHDYWCPNDCFIQYNTMKSMGISAAKSYFISVYSRMIKIPIEADWIEVKSAFGGMAIYKREAFSVSQYNGLREDGTEVCEHVEFHRGIRKAGYKIFINPRFVNTRLTEHFTKTKMKLILLLILREKGFNLLNSFFNKFSNPSKK
jgi:hypothetical protein